MAPDPPPGRPAWWPEGEPFPPPSERDWHGRGHRRRGWATRPLGCLVVVAVVLLVAVGMSAGLLAAFLAATGSSGLHPGRGEAIILLAVILLALATAARMGGRAVRPVGELIDAARRIEAGDLGVRVPQPRRPRELRDLAAAFNTMAARLEAEEANRRRLLADLSHELRTPIAVIEGHLEAVLDGVYPADAAHLGPILDEARVLDRLVDDLRTLSLAEAGALALHREATDIGHLVDDAITALRPRAAAAGATLAADVEPGLPELDLDPIRIRQVLSNLLDNAVRYTPTGGRVLVQARRRGPLLEVAVIDQGPGLAPEVRAGLFDRFVKAAESPGSGLGLAIAKAIVEAHGGHVGAEAGPAGVGTSVSLSLPLPAGPESAVPA